MRKKHSLSFRVQRGAPLALFPDTGLEERFLASTAMTERTTFSAICQTAYASRNTVRVVLCRRGRLWGQHLDSVERRELYMSPHRERGTESL
jgi:hypothetical protein